LPNNYDVEKPGRNRAGRMRPTKRPVKNYPTPNTAGACSNEADAGDEPPQ
jgi:hypothetical protein